MRTQIHGTTILGIRRKGWAVIGGDGQLTLEDTVIKSKGRKVRKLFKRNRVSRLCRRSRRRVGVAGSL